MITFDQMLKRNARDLMNKFGVSHTAAAMDAIDPIPYHAEAGASAQNIRWQLSSWAKSAQEVANDYANACSEKPIAIDIGYRWHNTNTGEVLYWDGNAWTSDYPAQAVRARCFGDVSWGWTVPQIVAHAFDEAARKVIQKIHQTHPQDPYKFDNEERPEWPDFIGSGGVARGEPLLSRAALREI